MMEDHGEEIKEFPQQTTFNLDDMRVNGKEEDCLAIYDEDDETEGGK